jgi:hypothetical protein
MNINDTNFGTPDDAVEERDDPNWLEACRREKA